MFKILLSIAIALGVAGVAYAAAAALNVDGGVGQYGQDTSLTCDDAVGPMQYTTAGVTDDTIDSVSIPGVSGSCDAYSVKIGLTGDSNGDGTGTSWTIEIYNGNIGDARGGCCNDVFIDTNNAQAAFPHLGELTDVHVTIY